MLSETILEMKDISKSFRVKALMAWTSLREGGFTPSWVKTGQASPLIKVITGSTKRRRLDYVAWQTHPLQIAAEAQNNGSVRSIRNHAVSQSDGGGEYVHRPKPHSHVNWKEMNEKAARLLDSLGIPASPIQELSTCSIAVQQMIAIARAVDMDCKILILDEPTSSLDEDEVQKLFELMRALKAQGVGIIFITHFLEQVYEISDRITVLRNGKLIGEYKTSSLPQIELISKMLGSELEDISTMRKHEPVASDAGIPVFEAVGLSSAAGVSRSTHHPQRRGTGLLIAGSGRSESVRAIFAADKVTGGEVRIHGKRVKIKTPLHAIKHGIGYLPEDRKGDGIIEDLSVRDNIILTLQVLKGLFKPFSLKEAEKFAEETSKLNIKTPTSNTPIRSLSGGNQQKVILARWLLTNLEYLILDEPTRGIDVGTKVEIQKLVIRLASGGMSLTFISSEIDEMLRTCSRLIVMKDREIVGELRGTDLTENDVMHMIAQGGKS